MCTQEEAQNADKANRHLLRAHPDHDYTTVFRSSPDAWFETKRTMALFLLVGLRSGGVDEAEIKKTEQDLKRDRD